MSSRLFRSSESPDAVPILWRQVGIAPVEGRRPAANGGASEADPRIAELQRDLEARSKAAYQQGQAAGEAAAKQAAMQRLEPVLTSLSNIATALAGSGPKFRKEAEEDTVKLAIAIARRVLHRELATDPEAILGVVIAAFQKLNARETHRLRVSPADAASLLEHRARLNLPPGIEIVSDTGIPLGSAIFETSRGELDASVDTQLAEIQRGFVDLIRKRAQ